jgi:protein phosphatase
MAGIEARMKETDDTLESALSMLAVTDTGRVRDRNEDTLYASPDRGLAILADGMGGANAGEVASRMAVDILSSQLRDVDFRQRESAAVIRYLHELILMTNQVVYQTSRADLRYTGMGTTLVMGCFADHRLYLAHMGDSRAYLLRAGRLKRLTRDHSPLQDLLDSGCATQEEIQLAAQKNLVNRALGVYSRVDPEIHVHDILAGDIYLFCSDGLTDMVSDETIAQTLRTLGMDLFQAGMQFIHLANDNGGMDNVSVILVKIRDDS